MPIQNIERHTQCTYYATEDTALFRQYTLAAGEGIPSMNSNRSVLLYVAEGSISVVLGNYPPRVLEAGTICFVPKNIGFYGHVKSGCRLVASLFESEIKLCNKYDLVRLQREFTGKAKFAPPYESFHN